MTHRSQAASILAAAFAIVLAVALVAHEQIEGAALFFRAIYFGWF